MSFAPVLALLATLLSVDASSLKKDFHVGYKGWNGLSEWKRLAEDLGCPIHVRKTLDWASLDGQDVLFVVHPETELQPEAFVAFLSAGGRAILADDFGKSEKVLAALGIHRQEGPLPKGTRFYRPDQNVPVALPTRMTPLGQATRELLGNHSAFFESSLPATYSFAPGAALVIEGVVGHGRFVAVADGSVFINNMLELPGNREFAAHLLVNLCRLQQDRLLLLHSSFSQMGVPPASLPGAPTSDSGHDLPDKWNRALGGANHHILRTLKGRIGEDGPSAVSLLGLLFCTASLLLLLRYLPLPGQTQDAGFAQPPKPPDTGLFASIQRYAGGAGQVTWGFVYPATLIREEFLFRLSQLVSMDGFSDGNPVEPKWVATTLRERVSDRAGRLGEKLWKNLRMLREDGPASNPLQLLRTRISKRKLLDCYALATELFQEMDSRTQK